MASTHIDLPQMAPVTAVITGTVDVNVVSSVLPTGAATAANQVIEIGHLASIDANIDVSLSTRASELTLVALNSKFNNDYGASAGAIRTASQIGNTAGAADFGAGLTTAQTLRVVLPTDQTAIPVSQSGAWTTGRTWTLASGTDSVTVAGTTTIAGTVLVSNFPTTVDTNYGTVGANTIRTAAQIGNATGAANFNAGATGAQTLRVEANQGEPNAVSDAWTVKVTDGTDTVAVNADGSLNITDNGGSLTVDGTVAATQSGIWSQRLQDGAGNLITSQVSGTQRALDVGINVAGVQIDPRAASPGTLTDRSGTAGSASAQMMAANAARKYLFIQNATTNIMWFNFTTAATNATPSIRLAAGETFTMEGSFISTEAIFSIRNAALNVPFTAKEG